MLRQTALLILCPLALFGQAAIGFTYQTSGGSASPASLATGGTIAFPAIAVGSASQVTIYCANQSQTPYSLSASVNNPSFSVAPASTQVGAGASAAIVVTFSPTAAGAATGSMSIILTPASGTAQVARFTLAAQAVDGVLASVTFAGGGNQTILVDGSTIAFPSVQPATQSAATLTIVNRTSASVSLGSILLSGAGFSLSGLPILPSNIVSGGQISVNLLFAPNQAGIFAGSLTWSISGASHQVLLSGTATASSLTFAVGSTTLQSGAPITFAQTAVGSSSVATLQINNTGNADAQIASISASPASFQLQNAPTLPLTIAAGASVILNLAFTPQTPGTISGTLTVGSATFALSGSGLGAQLTCAILVQGQNPATCDGASTVALPSTSLGAQTNFVVQITNAGNQAGTLQNFALGGSGFSVIASPSLPMTIAPGNTVQVQATFAPTSLGLTGGYVQVNNQTTNLTVSAAAPPPLPAISFTNVNPQMQPFAQPLVGIHLASAYPYPLAGQLSLTFNADSLIDDPSIQFINGQRYVAFTIPAGSTDAVFGTSALGVTMQTGTTSGVITLAASFSVGTYVLTGSSSSSQNITIPQAAPQIVAFQFVDEDASGFDLQVTGFSTTRSLSTLTFTFTPTASGSVGTTTLTADVSSSFQTWYASALSHSYGGQFSVTVRFNVTGSLSSLQSVSVTAANQDGPSTPMSLTLQSTTQQ